MSFGRNAPVVSCYFWRFARSAFASFICASPALASAGSHPHAGPCQSRLEAHLARLVPAQHGRNPAIAPDNELRRDRMDAITLPLKSLTRTSRPSMSCVVKSGAVSPAARTCFWTVAARPAVGEGLGLLVSPANGPAVPGSLANKHAIENGATSKLAHQHNKCPQRRSRR